MKKYFNVLVCLAVTQTAIAQSDRIGIDLGYQSIGITDEQVSAEKAKAWQPVASLNYAHEDRRGEFTVKVGAAIGDFNPSTLHGRNWYGQDNGGTPQTDSSLSLDRLYGAKVKVGYGWNILSTSISEDKVVNHRLLVGGSVNDQAFYSRNSARLGWLNAATLNADIAYMLHVKNRSLFRADVSVPVVGSATRQPFSTPEKTSSDKSDMRKLFSGESELSHLGNFQNVQFSASYEYALSQNWGLGVRYSGQWLRYSEARTLKVFEHSASLSINVKF